MELRRSCKPSNVGSTPTVSSEEKLKNLFFVLALFFTGCGTDTSAEDLSEVEQLIPGAGGGSYSTCTGGHWERCELSNLPWEMIRYVEFCCYYGEVGQFYGCWETVSICIPPPIPV